jgi:predicted nuclease of predicted toxin-antitoxin system
MTLWLDAHLSPRIARWITEAFAVTASPVRELGLRNSTDAQIFAAAREADAIVITKDSDFVRMLEEQGSPPKVIWLTCGNTSEEVLRSIFSSALPEAIRLMESGEELVEIGNP